MPIQRKEAAQAGEPAPDVHAAAIGTEGISRAGAPSTAVQRKPDAPSAGPPGDNPSIMPPTGGINKTGFIDNSDGANIRGFGQRFEVRVRIKGPSGEGTLVTVWQLERVEPRLITNWLEVYK